MHVWRRWNFGTGVQHRFAHHTSADDNTNKDSHADSDSNSHAHAHFNANTHSDAYTDSDSDTHGHAGQWRRRIGRRADDGGMST